MYKELAFLFIGVIIGIISMYYIMRSQMGDKYEIEADIKNKKGQMTDNLFKGTIDVKTPKKKRFKLFTKKKKDV